MMKSFIFVKMLKENLHVCLIAISGHLSEVNLNNLFSTFTHDIREQFSRGWGTLWIFGESVPHGFLNLGPHYVLLQTRFSFTSDVYFMQGPLTVWIPTTHIYVINGRALCTTCDVINSNVIRYSSRADSSSRLGLSVRWSGLDIDDIPTSKIEKQRYRVMAAKKHD